MILYAAIAAALFAVSAVATFVLGSQLPVMAVFPIPVAIFTVWRKPYQAAGLVIASGLAASSGMLARWLFVRLFQSDPAALSGSDLAMTAIWPGLYQVLFSCAGFLMGWGILRHWTYGRIVYTVSIFVFSLSLGHDLILWQEWAEQSDVFLGNLETALTQQMAQQDVELPAATRRVLDWLSTNWRNIIFGLNFLAVLAVSCLAVTVTSIGLRRWLGEPGPVGSFMTMRPSEWLIWAAILIAGLCFWDYYQGIPWVRLVAWNAGVGLAAVYWFNGLSILIYGTHVLRPPVYILLAVLIFVVLFDMRILLFTFGLFDTWADFRTKCDAYAAARKARQEDDF